MLTDYSSSCDILPSSPYVNGVIEAGNFWGFLFLKYTKFHSAISFCIVNFAKYNCLSASMHLML